MAYLGYEPSKVAVTVGQGVIDATHIQDASITTADLGNDSVTPIKVDDDGTGFQMGSLGLGTAVSGSEKLTVGGTASFSGAITGTLGTASQTNITGLGTITTGVWNGTAIASAYLDADTAHLSGSTFTGSVQISHGTTPDFTLNDTGGTTNKRVFRISGGGDAIYFEGRNNDNSGAGAVGGDGSIMSMSLSSGGSVAIGQGTSSTENLVVTSNVSSDHTRVHIEKTTNAGTAGVSMKSKDSSTWTIFPTDASNGDLNFYDGSDTVLALKTDNSAVFAGNITQSADTNLRHTITAGGSGEASLVLTANNSTGDSFVRWETNANTFCMGLDNSDSNKFILSCGSDPHSDSVINIQPDGSSIAVDKPISFNGAITTASTVLISGVSNYTGLEVKGSGGSRPQIKWSNVNNGVIGSIYGTEGNALVVTSGTGGATALTLDSSQNATFTGNIDGGFGKSHRFTGNWKVIDVVSEDSNDVSTMSSNNCFNDQTYSHFKIIIPWIGVESDGADILCSFLYNTGSGLTEATSQYYGHKQTATHISSGYSGGAYSNATRMTIFNNCWNDDSGGINGEVLVYNVTTADMRNFSGTTYTSHDHTGDGDRGSNFRPFATFNVIGYDTTNGYGAQHGSFRQNDDRHASYWKGIRFSTSTGNFATGSKFIVLGMQL